MIIPPSPIYSSFSTRLLLYFQTTANYLRTLCVSYYCYLCNRLCLRDISETFEPAAYPVADGATFVMLLDHWYSVAFLATLAVSKSQASIVYLQCSVTEISSTSNSHNLRWTSSAFLLIAWSVMYSKLASIHNYIEHGDWHKVRLGPLKALAISSSCPE